MRASLVIASHNEGDNLWRTVQSCLETADGLDCEVVVADDASTDGSLAELRRFPRARVVAHDERRGASPTKDLGARRARGEVLVFLDGHCKPDPGALARLVADVEATEGRTIVTPAVAALDTERWENKMHQVGHGYRIDLEHFGCGWIGLDRMRQSAEAAWLHESPALIGCCLAVSRATYGRLRGFDADMRFWGVEDIDFGLKAWLMGHPVLHDAAAVVGHRFRAGFDSYSVPMEHLVANQLRMARKNLGDPAWEDWVRRAREREPGWLWDLAWAAFEERRASVEEERDYLLSRRLHDESWYAARHGLEWPTAAPSEIKARRSGEAGSGGVSSEHRTAMPGDEDPRDEDPRDEDPELDPLDDPRELFLDHYRNPRNRRFLPAPDAAGTAHTSGGAVLTVYLKLGVDGPGGVRVEDACFQSQRCGVAVAYASLLTELVPGGTLEDALALRPEELMARFGEGAMAGASAGLAVSALRRAVANASRAIAATP